MLNSNTAQINSRSITTLPSRSHSSRTDVRIQALTAWLKSPSGFLTATVLFALAIRLVIVAIVFRDVSAPTFDHNEF